MSSKKRRSTATNHETPTKQTQPDILSSPTKKQAITPTRTTRATPNKTQTPTKTTQTPNKAQTPTKATPSKVTPSTHTTSTTAPTSRSSSRRQSRIRSTPPTTTTTSTSTQTVLPTPTQRAITFFGIDPTLIMTDIVEAIEDHVADGLDEMEARLTAVNMFKPYGKQVQKSVDDIQSKISHHLETQLPRLKMYALRNTFVIPEHVVLPDEQSPPPSVVSEAEDAAADAQIRALQQQIITLRHVVPKLRREIAGLDHDLAVFDASTVQQPFVPEDTESVLRRLAAIGADFEELNEAQQQLVALVAENRLDVQGTTNKGSNYRSDLARAPLSADQMTTLSTSMT